MPAPPRWLLAVPDAIRQLELRHPGRALLEARLRGEGVRVAPAGRRGADVREREGGRACGLRAELQALTNDYERFEAIVGKGERSG